MLQYIKENTNSTQSGILPFLGLKLHVKVENFLCSFFWQKLGKEGDKGRSFVAKITKFNLKSNFAYSFSGPQQIRQEQRICRLDAWYTVCRLELYCAPRGRILGRNPDNTLQSFRPCYSKSPLQLLPWDFFFFNLTKPPLYFFKLTQPLKYFYK